MPRSLHSSKLVEFNPAVRKRRRDERIHLPSSLTPLLPESALYSSLLHLERRVDASIARLVIEYQEALSEPDNVQQTMRLYLWHEVHPSPSLEDEQQQQQQQVHQDWTLRLHGHWLDEQSNRIGPGSASTNSTAYRLLSTMLDSLAITLEGHLGLTEAESLVEWHAHSSQSFTDGFEVHRRSAFNEGENRMNWKGVARVTLQFASWPRVFEVSTSLFRIVGVKHATLARIMRALWEYIATHRLLSEQDPHDLIADDALQVIMDSSAHFTFAQLLQRIENNHLTSIETVCIDHEIDLNVSGLDTVQIFDVDLTVPDLPQIQKLTSSVTEASANASTVTTPRFDTFAAPNIIKELEETDRALGKLMSDLHALEKRRNFLSSFHVNPVRCLQLLLAEHATHAMMSATTMRAQSAESAVKALEARRMQGQEPSGLNDVQAGPYTNLTLGSSRSAVTEAGMEERARRAEFYNKSEWVSDAIDRYLESKSFSTNKKRVSD